MQIIISPAKKMNVDIDSLPWEDLPQFLPQTKEILRTLQGMDNDALQALWGCSNALAALNICRLRQMDLQKNLTPAILCYDGIQYSHMAPGVFEESQFQYAKAHLRILSAFYGILRPFDGVTPYRLELQAKLAVGGSHNLYDFWGDMLAHQLCSKTDLIINLASKEYSQAVAPFLPKTVRFINCSFGELQANKPQKIVEKGTQCKMARGEMVRYMAENSITNPEEIKQFNRLGYAYSKELSAENRFVFIKETSGKPKGDAEYE